MGLFKIKDKYYVDINLCGKRIRRVAGTKYAEAIAVLREYEVIKQSKINERRLKAIEEDVSKAITRTTTG